MAENCKIKISSLSTQTAAPGDKLQLHGSWGETRDTKLPVINKGGQNELQVLSWSAKTIDTRIPENLSPGNYKVGVYCQPLSMGATHSSGFLTLTISDAPPTPEPAAYEELLQNYWWVILLLLPLAFLLLKSKGSVDYRKRH